MAGRPRKESVEEEEKEITEIADQVEEGFPEEEVSGILEFTSYGADIFDLIAGGGAPFKKIINLVGDASSGKSFICGEIISQAKKKYGKDLIYVYDDAESGFSFPSSDIWGFEMITENMPRSSTVEEFALNMDNALSSLKEGQRLIYILDSFDNLTSLAEIEDFEDKIDAVEKDKKVKGTYNQGKAKMTNQFFRIMANKIYDKNCLLVIVSQIRENLNCGMFGQKYYRAGGKSIDFISSQIFWLNIAEKYMRKEISIGVCIQVKNTKLKTGRPYRSGFIDLYYDYGLDNISSNIKYLYNLKTDLGKDVSKINKVELDWNGEKYSFFDLITHIENNGLEDELTKKVQKKWNDFEEEISYSVGRKKKYD